MDHKEVAWSLNLKAKPKDKERCRGLVADGNQSVSFGMADLGVSLLLLAVTVFLSEVARRTALKLFAKSDYCPYVLEIISTFQLCACTHELKLLSEVGRLEPQVGLTLTYLITVVHTVTFRGAICNPSGTLEHVYRRTLTGRCALARILCQFLAAIVARGVVPYVWALGLSDLHARHKLFGFKCISPINAPLLKATAVELGCAFAVHSAATQMQKVDDKYKIHAIAIVITTVVYAGLFVFRISTLGLCLCFSGVVLAAPMELLCKSLSLM